MWLQLNNAAKYAAVTIKQLKSWVEKGLICYNIDSNLLFHPYDIDDFIRSHNKSHNRSSKIANEMVKHLR